MFGLNNQLQSNSLERVKLLDEFIFKNIKSIKEWIYFEYQGRERMVYTSVDVRNAGFKVAPVDTNLFPAGFNNLDELGIEYAKSEFSRFIHQYYPKTKKILIISENFTRNTYYYKSLECITKIFSIEDNEVMIGIFSHDSMVNIESINLHPLKKVDGKIVLTSGWSPDLIVLNNDLTSGVPPILEGVLQPIIPHPEKGWHRRRKHNHFLAYDEIIKRFSEEFKIDPWFLSTYTQKCGQIDFRNRNGLECIATSVDKLLFKIQQKYDEYGIQTPPYAFVKADNGTFGIGVMSVKSGDELLNLNKKARHSMDIIKEGVQNKEVVIQEGVPTIHKLDNTVAEHIAYLVNAKVVCMITRANPSQDEFSNLNSRDMTFSPKSELVYGVEAMVAELAAIATLHEKDSEVETEIKKD